MRAVIGYDSFSEIPRDELECEDCKLMYRKGGKEGGKEGKVFYMTGRN